MCGDTRFLSISFAAFPMTLVSHCVPGPLNLVSWLYPQASLIQLYCAPLSVEKLVEPASGRYLLSPPGGVLTGPYFQGFLGGQPFAVNQVPAAEWGGGWGTTPASVHFFPIFPHSLPMEAFPPAVSFLSSFLSFLFPFFLP